MGELVLCLLNMSLTASFLIVLVILLRLVLKKAPKWTRGILWALVAVRLVCPFSLESKLSLVPDVDVNDFAYASMERGEQQALEEIGGADGPAVTFEAEIPAVITPNLPDDFQPSEPAEGFSLTITGADIAAAVWLAGVLVLLLYALVSYLRLRRRVAAAAPGENGVWLCDGLQSPFILGLFRPRIYLPSDIDAEQADYVLAHECAHLKRRDHWWKPLGFLLLAVYWFNPLIWVAYILLCRDIELACDEKVVRELGELEKKAYSAALLSCSVSRRSIAACPLAFGEVGVKARIKSVLNYKKPAFWIILVALLVCAAVAVCFLTDPVSKSEKQTNAAGEWENVQVILNLAQKVDPEAAAIAREYVQNIVNQQNDIYDPDNTLVNAYYYTAAKVTGLERINTGTAALDHSIDLYKLEYRLMPSDIDKMNCSVGYVHEENGWTTEQTSAGQPYLVILSEEQGTSLIGVTNETGLQILYGTDEMLERYGNMYTAAAMEIYAAYKEAGSLAGYTQAYQSSACLYMNPLSSFLPINGDSGCRYLMDGNRFAVLNKSNGITMKYEMPNGGWQQFPYTEKEWNALFWPEGSGAVDISGYSVKQWRPIEMDNNLLFLCRMDDQLWLVDQRGNEQMGKFIWSIYVLQPEHWSTYLQPEQNETQTDDTTQGAKTLEEAVHQAILDYHAPKEPDGLFYCESHEILETEERTPVHPITGKESHLFTVYAVVYHAGYSSAIREVTGSHIPTALTFVRGDDGTYELLEFWLPRDGSYYADDIRDKFPTLAAIAALNLQQYVEQSRADCDAQAAQYFGTQGPKGTVQKISERTDFVEWKGYTAVLTADTTLEDPYSFLLNSTPMGSDLIVEHEWIDLSDERELNKGDILLVIGEENGRSRVTVPYGDMPWIYGWVDSSLLSTNERNIKTGNQAILKGCPTYEEAGGRRNGEAEARVQILTLGEEWAWAEEYGTGAESYWVKTEDLNFDFDAYTVLDRPE